jgi:hypothetical protein
MSDERNFLLPLREKVSAKPTDEGSVEDAARDAWLASQGFRVLRFSNAEIAAKDRVLGLILEAALSPTPRRPIDPASVSLRLTPSPARGEGT